jgi:hypothetical protein
MFRYVNGVVLVPCVSRDHETAGATPVQRSNDSPSRKPAPAAGASVSVRPALTGRADQPIGNDTYSRSVRRRSPAGDERTAAVEQPAERLLLDWSRSAPLETDGVIGALDLDCGRRGGPSSIGVARERLCPRALHARSPA